jgi:hypothetical protein
VGGGLAGISSHRAGRVWHNEEGAADAGADWIVVLPSGMTAARRKEANVRRTGAWARRLLGTGGALAAAAALLLASSPALAQERPPASNEGPRFGQWGPGQAPPTAEGPEASAPPSMRAAPPPSAAPPRPGLPPPAPNPNWWGGCNFDLRGSWFVDGRQDQPGYRPYTTNLNVTQYANWLRIDQPDAGYTYYGQCSGNSITLDVYQGSQFIGYENGTADWGGGAYARWGGPRVRASWQTFVPSSSYGTETWHR